MHRPLTRPRLLAVVLAALVGASTLVTATTADAAKRDDPTARRQQVRQQRAKVAEKLNVLKASDGQVRRALAALQANLGTREAVAQDARRAADAASRDLVNAEDALSAKVAELHALTLRMKRVAIDAYTGTSAGQIDAILGAASFDQAVRRKELLNLQVDKQSNLADAMRSTRQDLAIVRQTVEAAQARANQRRTDAEAKLIDARQALTANRRFADQVESRLDAALAESDALASVDQKLSSEIARRQAALAAQVNAARRRAGGGGGGSVSSGGRVRSVGSGNVVSVGGIVVSASIAGNLSGLLSAAAADGYSLGGSGFRNPSDQVSLRRAHCGSSDYAVYDAPASSCRPPTARPGSSMHERGLAIDFTWNGGLISSRGNAAYRWLAGHASRYGFYNLPSEPWHWSTNGN